MNFLAQQTEVRRQLRDESSEFVTAADVKAWLNEAQRDLAHRTKLYQIDSGNVAAAASWALPATLIEIDQIIVGSEDEPVTFVSDDYFFGYKNNGDIAPEGYIARLWNGSVYFHPTPSTTFVVRYFAEPTDLSADGDTSSLPATLHHKMVYYATAMAFYKERENQLAQTYMDMYREGLNNSDHGVYRRIGGPLRLRREPSNWDIHGTHVS